MRKRNFFRSKSAKTNPLIWLVIGVLALMAFGVIDLSNLNLPFSVSDTGVPTGQVPVDKCLRLDLYNKYSGAALTSKTLLVIDHDTLATLHSLTTDGTYGQIATPVPYESGTELYVYYESSNDKQWFDITVPYMNPADAEANTYNDIPLESFAVGTYTSDTLMCSGEAITTNYNATTATGGETPTFTYTLPNSGADNTGLMDSYSPTYQQNFQTWVVVKFSGTGYETVVVDGFDREYTLGSANYGCDRLSSTKLTSWKVGSSYVIGYTGVDSISFSVDMTGYGVDTVTMLITAYAYGDPAYAASHGGSFGTEAVSIASESILLYFDCT